MTTQSQVELLLKARDEASDSLSKFAGALKGLGDTSDGVTESAHQLRDGLQEAFENPLGALQAFGTEIEHSLGPLGAIAGLGVAAVGGLTAAVVELGEHGAEVNDVSQGFQRFAGSADQASAILTTMRAGVQGSISDFALQTDALHLMSAGVQLSTTDYGTLTKAALVLGHEGFGPTKEILDQLTQSLITGRTRTIERMTGVLDAKEAEDEYATSIGVNAKELDKAGQAEAKRQEIMQRLRDVVDAAGEQELSFADRMAQMRTAVVNANDALSVAVATSPVLGELLNSVGTSLEDAFGAHQVQTIQTLIGWINQGAIGLVSMAESGLTGAKVLDDAWYGTREILANLEGAIVNVALTFARVAAAEADFASKLPGSSDLYRQAGAAARDWATWLGGVRDGLKAEGEQAIDTAGQHDAAIGSMQKTLDGLRQRMIDAGLAGTDAAKVINALGAAHDNAAAAVNKHQTAIDAIIASLEGDSKATKDQVAALDQLIARGITDDDVKQRAIDLITKLENKHIALTQRIYDWDDANREALASTTLVAAAMNGFSNALPVDRVGVFHDELTGVDHETGNLASFTMPQINGALVDLGANTDYNTRQSIALRGALEGLRVPVRGLADDIETSLDGALQSLPKLMEKAFTGGGGFSGAITAFGTKFGADMGAEIESPSGPLAAILPSSFDNVIGGALGALAGGGVGSLIASGIGKLASWIGGLFGPSQTELQGRQTESQFEQAMGGWQGIQQALLATGMSADEANAHLQALWAAEKQGSAAVQTQIAAINGVIQQHTTDISTGVQSILDAAKVVGSNFPSALQPVITQLASLPGLTDAEKSSLLGLVGAGQPSLQTLTDTAKKYGLTMDDLGSKTQQLDISTTADQVISDYKEMQDSGADMGAVTNHMASAVSSLVDEALQYGGTLPTALQPIAQALVNAGELTDSTGKKITDLSQLHFDDTGDPLASGLKSLTDAIDNLTKLLGGLPAVAQSAASGIGNAFSGVSVDVPVKFSGDGSDTSVSTASGGGYVTSRGIVYAAQGFPGTPSGSDTIPAWLTPGEAVLSRGAVARMGGREAVASINAGHGGGLSVSALHDAMHAAVAKAMQPYHAEIMRTLDTLPIYLKSAMRGAR